MFTGIYLALSQDLTALGKHGPVPPGEVDLMDLTTVAAFLGVGEQEAQQRQAWDRYRVGDPNVVMERKVRAEAN